MPSVDGHVVHGEAVRSLHKDHFSFWTKDRYEFQLISSARSSKSETSHSFWSAKEPNNYLPYLMVEHTLKQRMAISDTLDLVCEAEGHSTGSTSTSITINQTSSKKQGFGFTPTVKFERKGTVASGSYTHEIGNSSNWTSIHVRATAPVSWPEAVFSREFVQDFGLPGAVQVLWQRGASWRAAPRASGRVGEARRPSATPARDQNKSHVRGKLYRARSRLYRNQILQVNMPVKALAEIYTMHSFAQL